MLIDGARRGYWRTGHTPEERHELYKRLMLRVEVEHDGGLQISGTFGEALNGCVSDTIPRCKQTDNAPKVRFSATLGEEPEIEVSLA